jgi:hypothetical protein
MTNLEIEKSLLDFLTQSRETIVAQWTEQTLQGHEEHRFLLEERDRFRNPIGYAVRENLPRVFDALLAGGTNGELESALEEIVRVWAVQGQSPSRAMSFVFLIREIARRELKHQMKMDPPGQAMAPLEARIDRMGLLAFDLFAQCRKRILDIKAKEARRRVFVSERMAAAKAVKGQS